MATDRRASRRGLSVIRLRRWLAAGVITLLLALAGVLGYAHYKARRFLADLPGKLGISIKSETNGYTFTQSVKGHTLYSLHAAKAIQRDNGKTTLHDVAITIYGPVGSHRTDTVKGAEFEYDQPNGVIRATGEVHLDLASPSEAAAAKPGAKRLVVTTSGLVFLQKLGVAATDQPMQFTYGDMHGSAVGADYETDTGLLRLRSAVIADGTDDGRAVHIRAAAAEIDRNTELATLHTAHVQADDTTATGDTVLLTMAKGGGIQAVDARGNATLEAPEGVHAAAPHMYAHMIQAGKLDLVTMTGGVHLQRTTDKASTGIAGTAKGSTNTATGSSTTATFHFSPAGLPVGAVLDGNVQLNQVSSGGGTQALTAARVVADLMQDAARHTQLREATATGHAELHSTARKQSATGKPLLQTTVVQADALHATTAAAATMRYIATIAGAGSTRIEESDGTGNVRTSNGDTLEAKLSPPAYAPVSTDTARNPSQNRAVQSTIQTAVQRGHVVITQRTAAINGKPTQYSRATAGRADFYQATNELLLSGSPQVTGQDVQLTAERIRMAQDSGDAEATGSVSGTYLQRNANGKPDDTVHVLANRATISEGGDKAIFYGTTKPARMWASNALLDAAVIETNRSTGRLLAHGNAGADRLHLTLPQAEAFTGATTATRSQSGAVRITGGRLAYTPADAHQPGLADLSGGVRIDTPGSQLNSVEAVATLGTPEKQNGMLGGRIESVLATGDVRLQQPGRTANGERLLYTAPDERYELTGTLGTPPRVTDSLHGISTGAALVFHADEDAVEVLGEPGRRVRTETQASRSVKGR